MDLSLSTPAVVEFMNKYHSSTTGRFIGHGGGPRTAARPYGNDHVGEVKSAEKAEQDHISKSYSAALHAGVVTRTQNLTGGEQSYTKLVKQHAAGERTVGDVRRIMPRAADHILAASRALKATRREVAKMTGGKPIEAKRIPNESEFNHPTNPTSGTNSKHRRKLV